MWWVGEVLANDLVRVKLGLITSYSIARFNVEVQKGKSNHETDDRNAIH